MDLEPITEPHLSSSSSTRSSNYAFISHSQSTLPLTLPAPIENNAPFVRRRRRRRTSPHDQIVLEEEYRKCTKPDKARRKEICRMVQMGEKEVQIWFCNKRQAQRRRATPLQPHEMVPNSSRSMPRFTSSQLSLVSSSPRRSSISNRDPASESSVSSGFPISSSPYQLVSTLKPASHRLLHSEESDHHHAVTRDPESELPSDHDQEHEDYCEQLDAAELSQEQLTTVPKSQQTFTYTTTHTSATAMTAAAATTATSTKPTTTTQETKMTTSAHRRLQDALNGSGTPEQHQPTLPPPPPVRSSSNPRRTNSANPLPPPRLLRRSSSAVRLTTSLEGKATVILEDEPASSPPKPPPTPAPRTTKRRPLSTPVDSKLWEFCCDNQSAIQSPARVPPQPSEATQALRLLRTRRNTIYNNGGGGLPSLPRTLSQSQSITTTTKPAKQPPLPQSSSKRTPAKKQERKVITSTKKASRPKPLSSNNKNNHTEFSPSIDSDKENQPPGAPVSPPPEPNRRPPRALGVSGKGGVTSSSTPKKNNKTPRKKGLSTYAGVIDFYEDETQELVETSLSQDSGIITDNGGASPPRRIDEMECVENLLSLRGGTWR